MSVRTRNDYRSTRRAVNRATRRAMRRGSADAMWLSAISAGMTGIR